MSKSATIYRVTSQAFDPSADIQIITDISDMDNLIDDDATTAIINLDGSGKPKELSSIDNNEDPFTVVKAQQFIIQFLSSNSADMNTFASGNDQRWAVHSYRGTEEHTIFKGFLVLDDMSEDYLPEPNTVVLTANDGLGLLKDIPLTDFDGITPTLYNRIIDYIAWALSKTGLQLQINVAFNIKNQGYTTDISVPGTNAQHFFDINFLDAKTFEDQIGTCVNCYDVLERILGEEARLFQWQGKWWILRVDEVEHPTRGLYISTFSYVGKGLNNLGEIHFDKEILNTEDATKIFWLREQTRVVPTRPLKSLKLTHKYETPIELIENIDFDNGEFIENLPDETIESITYTVKKYSLSSWKISSDFGGPYGSTCYVKRYYFNGQEKERYAVVTPSISSYNADECILSKPMHVSIGDKISISVDIKLDSDISNSSNQDWLLIKVIFKDDSGQYWKFDRFDNSGHYGTNFLGWAGPYFTIANSQIVETWKPNNINESQKKNIVADLEPFPASGELYIGLMQFNQHSGSFDTVNINYSDLKVTYTPLINGSYQKYTGQSFTITQNGNYKAKRVKQVYIGNLPKRVLKGALHTVAIYNEAYNDTAQFFTDGSFKISGDWSSVFERNQRLLIQDTSLNNQFCVIKIVTYHVVGDETEILTNGTMLAETITAKLSIASFQLSGNFTNAAVFPDLGVPGPEYFKSYGEMQAYDVWNQFKNDMRVFQAVCQGLDLNSNGTDGLITNLHFISKISIPDVTNNTNDRFFSMLTFAMDLRTVEWSGTIREVYNTVREKDYASEKTFKYETG